MMPEGSDPAYRAAYARPHKAIFRCEVWDNVGQLEANLPIIGGEVKCTLGSQVTRSGSLTVDASLMPRKETDLLAPFGNRLRLYRGIEYGGRQFWCRTFTGLITKVERKPRSPVTVTFADRASEVDENDFEAAEEAQTNNSLVGEIVRLIRDGVRDAEFGTHDQIAANVPAQVYDDSRSNACDQLADAGGAFWYALADGSFVIRRVPWAFQPDGAGLSPVVSYNETGDTFYGSTNGTITDYGELMSRENIYNVVVGESDQPDGAAPRRAVVRDTLAESPTYVGGKFGRRVMRVELPSAATDTVVRHSTEATRRRSRASAEATPWSMVPDPALELGDLVELRIGGRRLIRCVSDFTIPMTESGDMSCSGRPVVLADGSVINERIGF
jgi:hypothetical protein